MRPRPINDAEAVIEVFWEPYISSLDDFTFIPGPNTGATIGPTFSMTTATWHDSRAGEPIFTMSRDVEIPIEHYDALRIRCGVPSSAGLTLKAVLDGKEQIVVNGVTGPDKKWEFTGPISGRRLERITIELRAFRPGAGAATLQYINLVNREIEKIRLSRSCPYTPDWPRFLKPAHEPIEVRPDLGLVFNETELAGLRKKVRHPAFKALMDQNRARARELMVGAEPERFIMESSVTTNRHHRAHEIERGESNPFELALTCGFVGIVDGDIEMLRMCARAMLAMAHSQYWDECFQEHFPGSSFDHRAFTGMEYAYSCALGLDWAGSTLTETGRRIIFEAISKKGMSLINKDFVQYEYIFHCNQAAGFSQGRLAGLLAMRSVWPRADAWIEQAKKDLMESLDLVFNATADHGGREGPSYTGATLYRALLGLMLLARHEGKTLAEITPPGMIASTDYCLMFLSTVGEPGSYIPCGDGGVKYDLDTVSLMALASGDPRWESLREIMVHRRMPSDHATTNMHTLVYTEPPTGPGQVELPTFCLLPSTGMLESCRQTPDGPVRLQLIGAAEGAGHAHQDRGSFILEAFGDTLAMDRGCLSYGHPLLALITAAHMHNVLSPKRTGDREPEQTKEVKVAIVPNGRGDERSLDAEIDTTAIWNGQFKRHVRHIHAPEPTVFNVDDQVEFDQPSGATFHLHTQWPIERQGDSFVIRGEHANLVVTPKWTLSDARHGEDFVARYDQDGEQPANHLALTSEPGTNYHLVTVLEIVKAEGQGRLD